MVTPEACLGKLFLVYYTSRTVFNEIALQLDLNVPGVTVLLYLLNCQSLRNNICIFRYVQVTQPLTVSK